jgi:hypothetical protein
MRKAVMRKSMRWDHLNMFYIVFHSTSQRLIVCLSSAL